MLATTGRRYEGGLKADRMRRRTGVRWAAASLTVSVRSMVALHDKRPRTDAIDDSFVGCLPLIERAAADERNFVKKSVSWALRAIGRRNMMLNVAALALAKRLATSDDPARRWVGKDAVRELTNPKVRRRITR